MEAPQRARRVGLVVTIVAASSLWAISLAQACDDVFGGVDGDTASLGCTERETRQDDGSGPAQNSQPGNSEPHPYWGERPYERESVPACENMIPGVEPVMCDEALACPENDEPGSAGDYVLMRHYERALDPETGEPASGWTFVGSSCVGPDEEDQGPSLFELVMSEWQSVQIPSATIGINPAGGRTLVNLPTIFHTTTGEQQFPVTLLGRSVIIYAIPVEYTWHHGDGTAQSTTGPGAPYPGRDVSHTYRQTGSVTPRVDVRYRAEFTVDGGERQPIPGEANVTGTGESLQVLEARAQLVDG